MSSLLSWCAYSSALVGGIGHGLITYPTGDLLLEGYNRSLSLSMGYSIIFDMIIPPAIDAIRYVPAIINQLSA